MTMDKRFYLILFLVFCYGELRHDSINNIDFIPEKPVNIHDLSFSDKKKLIYNELVKHDIKHPNVVLAQSILETGNFNSYIFKKNNNLFGMKLPNRRETTAIGTHKGYANYNSWGDSVKDYSLYQEAILNGKELSEEQYLNFIGRKYAEETEYIGLLKKIIIKNKI